MSDQGSSPRIMRTKTGTSPPSATRIDVRGMGWIGQSLTVLM